MAIDEKLLAALNFGLPDCCGVAVGLDRVLMLAGGHRILAETLSFPPGR
jgi:lysyl-tRNA synthetase class 2